MVDATGHNETADLVYIGREAEFGALWSVYRDTELTGVRSVVVEGTSGVGKSALVEQFVRQLRVAAHDVVVFSGRCHERESVPYKAFDAMIDELGRWLQTLDNERFSALVPDTIDVLFQVFPALRTIEDRPAEAAPMAGPMTLTTESRRRAFDTLAEVLCRIARWRPLVLVTDDIHWADPDSVALLRHLVRKTSQASFMLLATARDEGTTLPDVFNALGDTARRIPLGPLSPTETQQLAASLFELRSARPDLDLAAVTRESHGHPMFVRELVAYANRTGRASANLDDALWTRASELDASSLALLELVAVAGTPMAQGVIATAAGLEPPAYARSIGHLRSRHLVRQRGARNRDTIEPYHDRVREALYTRIDQIRRVQLHGQLAAALEQLGGGADPLADHLEKAEQPAKAAEYALRAARAAARALAFERAVSRYRQALRLAGPNANGRAQMLIEFGDVAIDAGRADEAAEAFIEASNDESLEPDVRRDLRRRVAEQFLMGGNLERGLSEMQTMLSEVGLRLPRSRASLVARLLWHQWRIGRHSLAWEPCSEDSLSAQQLTRLDTYWSVGAGTGVVDSPLSALFMTQGARECLAVGEPFRLARSLTSASISEMAAGRPKQAERMLDAATRAAEAADSDMARSYVLYAQAMKHHMVEGDWPACGAAADEALALWRKAGRGRGWEWDTLHLFKCWSLHFMQRLADLRAYCDPLIASAVATGNRFQEVNIRLFAFMSLVADDEPDAALAYVDDAMSRWIPVSEVFSNQAYYALRARSYVAVYSNTEGDPSRVMNNEWRRFDRTLMGQVAVIRAEAHMLRAQESLGSAASAAARQDQRQMRRHMRRAAHHIRSLRKVNNGVSDIAAPLLEAGLEHLRGNADGVVAILREALPLFESRRMVCYTGSARRRLGALIGGDEGSALVASADATYADQGILNPAKMTRTCCPGWPEDFT